MTKQQAPSSNDADQRAEISKFHKEYHLDSDLADASRPGPSIRKIPAGDTHERTVCPDCGFIAYQNPKMVVGAVATWRGKILLCKRAIEPRQGFWTIPAGYLELNETPEEGAIREAWEEANAKLTLTGALAIYTIPGISQIQIIYRADLEEGVHAPGEESLDTKLFDYGEIPWDALAFPSVHWALTQYNQIKGQDVFPPFSNPRDLETPL